MAQTVDKSKKRKRNADESSKPSKKVAIAEDRKVKISVQEGDEWVPIIASTPGVSLPTSTALKPYTKPRKNPKKIRGPIASSELLLHSSAHPKLDYTAREEESAGVNAMLKHYVGVYDPETGMLEVLEARKMVVRGVVRAHEATAEDQAALNMREQRNNLGQAFGTKKAKKAIASVTENAISARGQPAKMDAVAQAMLASMAKDTEGIATQEQLAAEANAAKPRPMANLAAADVQDVYTADSLIGLETLKMVPVFDWQQNVKKKIEIEVKSEYVANRMVETAQNTEKLKILRYLLLLIEIHRSSPLKFTTKRLPKREEMSRIGAGVPEAVMENIRRRFAPNNEMNKYQTDLLTTHICALACLVDNYTVDMYDLQADLNMDVKQMSQYFSEIGAKVTPLGEEVRKKLKLDKSVAAQRKLAKLRLPLEFPRMTFFRRK